MNFVRLTNPQLDKKIEFIDSYMLADTAADAATLDANANVSTMNIATMQSKLHDDINIQINRRLVYNQLRDTFSSQVANKYIEQLEAHLIYCHDETSILPYCVSISMYPFLLEGLTNMGGESRAPKHLESYCGGFVNLVFAIASQFAGAVATVEFLTHFDHFARIDYGDNYIEEHTDTINNHLQHVVYALNQPAAARGFQTVFWNISILDRTYFDSLFGDFYYPDGTSSPVRESVMKLQNHFMKWFNSEREKCLLTFPVITASLVNSVGKPEDEVFAMNRAKDLSEGSAFFLYQSDSVDSLSSCCRLRNEFVGEKPQFSYSLGAGGIMTGSSNVITLNMNRLEYMGIDLEKQIELMHKFQVGHRKVMERFMDNGLLTAYDAGYISLDKQYLTIGINGMLEAWETNTGHNIEFSDYASSKFKVIYDANRLANSKYGYMFNTELVPAENLGVKFAKWDKEYGMVVSRDCYNSYLYAVEDSEWDVVDKFILHGAKTTKYLDGGSALHLNLHEFPDADSYYNLICLASKTGCPYWTTNILATCCEDCNHINKKTKTYCVKCGSTNIEHATRIVGYLKKIKSYSMERKIEASVRGYHDNTTEA